MGYKHSSLRADYHAKVARVTVENWVDHDLQAMVDLAREVIGVPLASITVLDGDTFHFLVSAGSDPFCADYDDAMCKYSMEEPGVFSVPDTLADERMVGLPYVDGRAGSMRFYASAPVYARDHAMVGRFCLFDTQPRELEPEHEWLLAKLGHSAGKAIQRAVEARPEGAPLFDADRSSQQTG